MSALHASELSENRLLVLGASGNVGQHVVRSLVKLVATDSGEAARILVGTRTPETWEILPPLECPAGAVAAVHVDLGDPASISAAIASAWPLKVFLCLPQALGPDAMVVCGNAVADACAAAGVVRLVRVASRGIDDPSTPQGALGAAHVACEAHCRKIGLALSSVRPTSFHTNFLTYDAASIRSESVFRSPLGADARVNWVHCADIGAVAAALLARPAAADAAAGAFEAVDVTGPADSTLSAPEMAALLTRELGRPIRYEEVAPPPVASYEALWAFLRAGGFDCVGEGVHEHTGRQPVSFVEVVRQAQPLLVEPPPS